MLDALANLFYSKIMPGSSLDSTMRTALKYLLLYSNTPYTSSAMKCVSRVVRYYRVAIATIVVENIDEL